MNKIINWTFGAFFRTIGRIFAFLCISILFVFILSKLDIKFPKWLSFRVNAAEITIPVQYKETGTFNTNVSLFEYSWAYKDFTSTTDNTRQEFLIPFTTYIDGSNSDYIEFDLMITEPTTTELTSENVGRYCSKYSSEFAGYVEGNVPTYDYTCQRYTQYISGESIQVVDNNFSLNSMQIYIHYSDNTGATCTLSNTSKLYCPTNKKQIKDIGINIIFKTNHTSYMRILVSRDYNLYIGNMQEMINKQEETNNKLDDMNNTQTEIKDSINNSDISGANNSAGGFFDNFTDNDYGLSSIITSPLRAINSMLNDTCVAPGATYKGQSFSLPCGSMLWTRPGGEDFRNFINIFYGGFLAYFVIRSLFLDIEKLKNPDNDKVEVEKL